MIVVLLSAAVLDWTWEPESKIASIPATFVRQDLRS
jgi:hypothetical protein